MASTLHSNDRHGQALQAQHECTQTKLQSKHCMAPGRPTSTRGAHFARAGSAHIDMRAEGPYQVLPARGVDCVGLVDVRQLVVVVPIAACRAFPYRRQTASLCVELQRPAFAGAAPLAARMGRRILRPPRNGGRPMRAGTGARSGARELCACAGRVLFRSTLSASEPRRAAMRSLANFVFVLVCT